MPKRPASHWYRTLWTAHRSHLSLQLQGDMSTGGLACRGGSFSLGEDVVHLPRGCQLGMQVVVCC